MFLKTRRLHSQALCLLRLAETRPAIADKPGDVNLRLLVNADRCESFHAFCNRADTRMSSLEFREDRREFHRGVGSQSIQPRRLERVHPPIALARGEQQ